MTLNDFLDQLQRNPETLDFSDTMAVIDELYDYQSTAFENGQCYNASGQNAGSCKLFAFAQLQGLDVQQTLFCFGHYYRDDVLGNPDGDDHQNIRNFIQHGWKGIDFHGQALTPKQSA